MKKIRIIALISAIAFMVFVGVYISGLDSKNSSKGKGDIEVLVAIEPIPAHTILTETSFKKVLIPSESVSENAIKDVSEVVGKMTSTSIYTNEIVLKEHILQKPEGDSTPYGLAHIITPGKRAMSIEVTAEEGVSTFLKVGNYVDVFFTGKVEYTVFSRSNSGSNGEAANEKKLRKDFSKLLLQDIKVIGLDSSAIKGSDTPESTKDDKKKEYKVVTLELTPEEFTKLALATKDGNDTQVWLGLRSQGDHEKAEVNEITIDDIVDKAKILKELKEEFER